MTQDEAAWLEYQVIMRSRLDLEKLSRNEREIYKAIFQDGYNLGRRDAT